MADCSKTDVFLAEWERMCDCTECNLCGFGELDNVEILPCDVIARDHTKDAMAVFRSFC